MASRGAVLVAEENDRVIGLAALATSPTLTGRGLSSPSGFRPESEAVHTFY
jgi:hypothetical protein